MHRNELEKVEKQREADKLRQNQELKDLTNAFETEAQRLNEIVNMKDRMIDNLNKENNKEKQRILEITKNYEN